MAMSFAPLSPGRGDVVPPASPTSSSLAAVFR